MYIDSAAAPLETATSASGNELAEGVLLLRASALKIIRLQLAIERGDRHLALGTVDGLVALDRRLQDYLERIPATGEQRVLRRESDLERAALNVEKLGLAAEILRRPANIFEQTDSVEQMDSVEQADPAEAVDDWLGPRDLPPESEEPRRNRRWLAVLSILFILVSSLAGAAWLIGPPDAGSSLTAAERWLTAAETWLTTVWQT